MELAGCSVECMHFSLSESECIYRRLDIKLKTLMYKLILNSVNIKLCSCNGYI